jgi:hypothetical protein
MTVAPFDSHAVFKRLQSSGMSEATAEAMANELMRLALQREIAEQEQRLIAFGRALDELRNQVGMERAQDSKRHEAYQSEIRSDLERLELRLRYDLTIRLGGMLGAGVAFLAAIKVFGH